MATEAQIRANQQNAQKSTGPKTPEGKARSAQNGRIHGLCAQTMLLPEAEDRERFVERCDEISRQYQFEHALKQTLVFAIASAEHQILFINRIKRGAASHLAEAVPVYSDPDPYRATTLRLAAAFTRDAKEHDIMSKFNRYEVEQHRILHRSLTALEALYDKWKNAETEPVETADEANPIPEPEIENKPVEPANDGFTPASEPKVAAEPVPPTRSQTMRRPTGNKKPDPPLPKVA